MKSKKNIVFLGMMGSGKSLIGRLVSKKLKLQFFDIDNIIEIETGMKIFEIFEKKGEEFFREIEKNISLKILKKNKSVISLGGGAFQNNEIRKEVLNGNISIWLKWNYQTLLKRIIDKPHRPLAYNIEKKELIELMKKRSKFYKKALYKINCEDLTKNKIINRILNINELH
tara:strand:- start:2039 stop:2551 length:513 start_codon:yes stop_codon:yes gene_type:complete